jgi:hypothetical protein
MLRPTFNRLGQMLLHFGTSVPSRIQRDALVDRDVRRLKTPRRIAGLINAAPPAASSALLRRTPGHRRCANDTLRLFVVNWCGHH